VIGDSSYTGGVLACGSRAEGGGAGLGTGRVAPGHAPPRV